jgi:hypothetical protein
MGVAGRKSLRRKFIGPRAAAGVVGLLAAVSVSGCGFGMALPVRDEAGAVTAEVETDAFALTTGDCILDPGEEDIYELTVIPCAQEHDWEAFAVTELPDGDFPGDQAVGQTADTFCLEEFERFVGLTYEDSELDFFSMYPSGQSWLWKADREVLCLVGEWEKASAGGSLRNAGR